MSNNWLKTWTTYAAIATLSWALGVWMGRWAREVEYQRITAEGKSK